MLVCRMTDNKDKPDIFEQDGKTYYRNNKDVLAVRKANQRIYYDAYKEAYYLVTPKKRSFWGFDDIEKPKRTFWQEARDYLSSFR